MVQRKWTNHEINDALQRLGAYYELPPERSAGLEARIRRDVIARFGSFSVPTRQPVHIEEATGRGILVLLRPAFALAGVAAVAVGAVFALQRSGWGPFRSQGLRQPVVAPPAEVVAVATPIVPGSGVAVSVFGQVSASSFQLPATSIHPVAPRRVRRAGKPINPASGVFDQWGESVFSEEGLLQNEREGKNIFTG